VKTCARCYYSMPVEGKVDTSPPGLLPDGLPHWCRRYPPTSEMSKGRILGGESRMGLRFPVTVSHFWCGEWKQGPGPGAPNG
jgi:hypothetical protein